MMRKVIMFNMLTLDGYFEGPKKEIDWHNVDSEFNDFSSAQLDSVDTLLFGRMTYEMMASYWPTPEAIKNDPVIADKMNSKSKIVFSNTLNKAEWNNSRLLSGDLATKIMELKKQPGKDLILFGSASLAVKLMKLGLIDEYRVMVNPIILGNGRPLFECINKEIKLNLISARAFRSGNVLLTYQPIGQ
jgi:dihydrofolate reductase